MKAVRGVALVELLVTLALGAIVLGGVLRTFAVSQDVYRVQEDTARMQENLRFASQEMAGAIRQATFLGGARAQDVFIGPATSPASAPCTLAWDADPANGLKGFEGTSRSPAPACTVSRYVAGSDLVVATFADPGAMPRPSDYSAGSADFGSGNLFLRVLVGAGGAVFDGAENRAAAVLRIPGTETDGIHEYRLRTIAYSLGIFDDPSDGLPPTPTLYVCDSAVRCGTRTNPQPLVEGIEQLQLDYGVDGDGDRVAERFLAARDLAPAAWATVVAVRVGLVARGERPAAFGEARDYALPGGYRHRPADDPRTPADERRLARRALVQSVQIRNRVRG